MSLTFFAYYFFRESFILAYPPIIQNPESERALSWPTLL